MVVGPGVPAVETIDGRPAAGDAEVVGALDLIGALEHAAMIVGAISAYRPRSSSLPSSFAASPFHPERMLDR